MTITALHDQKKRLVFVSPLNVLAGCVIAMYVGPMSPSSSQT